MSAGGMAVPPCVVADGLGEPDALCDGLSIGPGKSEARASAKSVETTRPVGLVIHHESFFPKSANDEVGDGRQKGLHERGG